MRMGFFFFLFFGFFLNKINGLTYENKLSGLIFYMEFFIGWLIGFLFKFWIKKINEKLENEKIKKEI